MSTLIYCEIIMPFCNKFHITQYILKREHSPKFGAIKFIAKTRNKLGVDQETFKVTREIDRG